MKQKSKLFLNIATIALCLCAIAVGVYSAKTASLNVGGTVGFVAHNCEIHINGKITGTTDDTASALTYDQDLTSGTTANTWNFGSISFEDNHSDTPAPIVFTITFTNNSAFKVQSVLTLPSVISKTSGSTTLNSITAKIYNNSDVEQTTTDSKYTFVLGEKNSSTASVTLKVKLMLNNNDESIDTSTLSNFGVTFEKYNVVTLTFSLSANWSGAPTHVLYKNGVANSQNAVTEIVCASGTTWFELIEEYDLILDWGTIFSGSHAPNNDVIKSLSSYNGCRSGGEHKYSSFTENNPTFTKDTAIVFSLENPKIPDAM